MKLHRMCVAVITAQLVLVLGTTAMAAPKVAVSVVTTSSNLNLTAQGSPLKGTGTFKYGKANYVITITGGYISPNGNAARLTGTVPVNGVATAFTLSCDQKTGYLELAFGTVKFWSKSNVAITK